MRGEANIALCSRLRPGRETYRPPFARHLGIRYFSWLVSLMLGSRVYGTTGLGALGSGALCAVQLHHDLLTTVASLLRTLTDLHYPLVLKRG